MSGVESRDEQLFLKLADIEFKKKFLDNPFGYACSICDWLWFKNELKDISKVGINNIFRNTLIDTFQNKDIQNFMFAARAKLL